MGFLAITPSLDVTCVIKCLWTRTRISIFLDMTEKHGLNEQLKSIVLIVHNKQFAMQNPNMVSDLVLYYSYHTMIQFLAIDLTHNLYLGTGKDMFSIWVERGIISNQDLKQLMNLSANLLYQAILVGYQLE